jgi:predicted phosphoribosyltransferase
VWKIAAEIHDITEFRNQRYIFFDRFDAGKILGWMLHGEFNGIEDGMVLAIPSGGVSIGLKVSEILRLPLDFLIVRKLQIPENSEAGFGAMTLDGTTLLNHALLTQLGLSRKQIEQEKYRVRLELEKRNKRFRNNRPFPNLEGKKVILVDDGLASGFTMLTAVDMARKSKALEIIVAVPTAPRRTIDLISPKTDKLYCANIRDYRFFAVADAYQNWHDLTEKEVVDMLAPP